MAFINSFTAIKSLVKLSEIVIFESKEILWGEIDFFNLLSFSSLRGFRFESCNQQPAEYKDRNPEIIEISGFFCFQKRCFGRGASISFFFISPLIPFWYFFH